ncbi:BZZ1 [[Candida] subhashii]|uniref:Protein BZZ1 n=1 Tax=[Candida] subhashii TaxID=561895 RepID=A0A8J5UJ57_9ASCO|nr:BZZ1 [[Candida] subhashii]KAG7661547.1 BZZ1 [[Candida] subhashii]
MSAEDLSIGNELRDSYKITSKWIANGTNWLSDIDEFYRERSNIEREYATKLTLLCKKHFDKKSKISASLSVGDEPQITPGSLECASLVLWSDLLTQTEAIANERMNLGGEFSTKICNNLVGLKAKCERISRQVEQINEYLTQEKKNVEDEVLKAKKHYDTLCQATETAREKTERSESGKYQERLDKKTVEMNIGKNEYLIKLNVANRLKDKYYYQDVPEILDYFQELNENRVGILNKLLKNASIIERNSNDKIKEKLHSIDETIDQNNPKLDVAMFIKHNSLDWKEPPDFYFIPSSIWHDDESLVTKEPELTVLKKRLNVASGEYATYEQSCLDIKQKLEESTAARKEAEKNLTLKFDGGLQASLSILQKFMKEDTIRVRNEVEIEVIQNFAGDKDLTYIAPIERKKSKFGFLKRKSTKESITPSSDVASSDSHSLHTVKTNNTASLAHTGIFNLRRNKTSSSTKTSGSGSGKPTAKALYAYAAGGNDETSISAGDELTVVEEDTNGSGWTMVNGPNGPGLVPTAYIQISAPVPHTPPSGDTPAQKKKGPMVMPRRGAKKIQYVEALYDYTADGDDELSIRAGDRIVLVQDDTDGSGWTEGELNGAKGLFPTSYVRKV